LLCDSGKLPSRHNSNYCYPEVNMFQAVQGCIADRIRHFQPCKIPVRSNNKCIECDFVLKTINIFSVVTDDRAHGSKGPRECVPQTVHQTYERPLHVNNLLSILGRTTALVVVSRFIVNVTLEDDQVWIRFQDAEKCVQVLLSSSERTKYRMQNNE
jgi:hypothetical protein